MKKTLAIFAVASFVAFSACKTAPKNEECTIIEEVVLVEENEEEIFEEFVVVPTK